MYKENSRPYVISSDLHGLMVRWSQVSGYALPNPAFFKDMSKDLESVLSTYYNGNVEVVSEHELRSGLENIASCSEFPIISLDRAYVDKNTPNVECFIDMTRAVNENMDDVGLFARPGSPPLDQQLQTLYKDSGPVALLDDVIFTGNGIYDLAVKLEENGRPVKQVISGVTISEGANRLKSLGIEVLSVREYDDVVDEVCERDYYAGVPMSGRTIISSDGTVGSAPYFKPFGNPERWATIPSDKVSEFSEFCLTQSLVLWATVGRLSQSNIPSGAVPRKIFGVPEEVAIVSVLKEHIDNNGDLSYRNG